MSVLFIKMLPLLLLSLAGYGLYRKNVIDAKFTRQLSLVMLNFFYPCLIASAILRNFTWETLLGNWMMPVGALLIMVTGWLVGALALPLLKRQEADTRRSFHFICLMNNYSFLPIILGAALWGEKAVALVAFASLGAELCVWTLGVKALTGQRLGPGLLRHLVSLPMLALLVSCGLLALRHCCGGWASAGEATTTHTLAATLLETAHMAGAATIPASALICGARIAMLHPGRVLSPLMAGTCLLRLAVIPALCIAALALLAPPPEVRRVLVLIAVQPAAMASVSMAEAYRADATFAAAAVLATHLLCLATIPLWLGLCL